MHLATVSNLEYGINIITDNHPVDYFNSFGNKPLAERYEQDYGLYYYGKSKSIVYVCYDKLLECKKKKFKIPEEFKDKHLLRLEIRYKKNIAKHFNCKEVLACMLYDKEFFIKIHNEWYNYYTEIQKIQHSNFDCENINTCKKLDIVFANYYVDSHGGALQTIEHLNIERRRKKLTSKQKYDLKKKITNAINSRLVTVVSKDIVELNEKVKKSYLDAQESDFI